MITVFVRDENEALAFYTDCLGFEKYADTTFGPGVRWLTVKLPRQEELEVVLQKPNPFLHGEEGAKRLENRIGQGTTTVIYTDDLLADIEEMRQKQVKIISEPSEMPWGRSALITDLYGNLYNLVQPHDHPSEP